MAAVKLPLFRPGFLDSLGLSDRDVLALVLAAVAVPFAWAGWQWITLVLLVASSFASAQSTPGLSRIRTTSRSGQIRLALVFGGFGLPVLTLLRMMVLLLLGLRLWSAPGIATPIILTACLLAVIMIPARLVASALDSRLTRAVMTRNLTIKAAPGPTPAATALASGLVLALPELVIIICGTVVSDQVSLVCIGGAFSVLLLVALTGLTSWMIKTVGNPYQAAVLRSIRQSITQLAPQVCLYVSGTDVASLYQINGWLETLESVREPAMILMRSHEQLASLGPSTTPTVSVPSSTDFLSMDLSSLRAGLYLANTGDVIHLIREPRAMSAFIGHGDSDKNSSFNPFSKVYDQIWLAGEAGARRYRRAHIGIHEDQFVYVGRPQLDSVRTATDSEVTPPAIPTILYAPTWEGWNAEQQYTSLLANGLAFIEAALASPTPVRVVYKPHPYNGRRSARTLAAHRRIVAALTAANAAAGRSAQPSQRLSAKERSALESMSAVAAGTELTAFADRFWKEVDPQSHVVIEGGDIDLYACFNAADLLATDVSSVISDFIASDKPFAVFNTGSTTESEFRQAFPSTAAGIVISAGGDGIDEVIAVATGRLPDEYRQNRGQMRLQLLGPTSPTATTRFVDAVSALVAAANERSAARSQELRQ
ncbi:MAG: hypothetical protein WCI74_02965 [Actinomycetes bacterium]